MLTFTVPGKTFLVRSTAVQPDGKVLIAGIADYASDPDFLVARVHPNGALDDSFGGGGLVYWGSSERNEEASAVCVHSDGKIFVAGHISLGLGAGLRFGAIQLLSNGDLDPSFGSGGVAQQELPGVPVSIRAAACAGDGRCYLGGAAPPQATGAGNQLAVIRLTPEGQLDQDFGHQGFALAALSGWNLLVDALALQPDGDAVVAGDATSLDHSKAEVMIARLRGDGSLDPDFGTGGITTTAVEDHYTHALAVTLDAVGRPLIAGTAFAYGYSDPDSVLVARYTASGALDRSFGGRGYRLVDPDFDGAVRSIQLRSDGRILAAGARESGEDRGFWLGSLFPDGELDLGFGAGGIARADFQAERPVGYGLEFLPDDKVMLVGHIFNYGLLSVGLARFRIQDTQPAPIYLEILPDRAGPGESFQAALGLTAAGLPDTNYLVQLQPGGVVVLLKPREMQFVSVASEAAQMAGSVRVASLLPSGAATARPVFATTAPAGELAVRAFSPAAPRALVRDPALGPGAPLTIAVATTSTLGDLYLAVLLPTGEFFSFTGLNQIGPTNTIQPLLSNLTQPNQLVVALEADALPADLPPGPYLLVAAMAPAGGDILNQAEALGSGSFFFESSGE
ncbi:MAG TPA: hypothetical protein VGB99_03165 [Acidobacteriota bacterium]